MDLRTRKLGKPKSKSMPKPSQPHRTVPDIKTTDEPMSGKEFKASMFAHVSTEVGMDGIVKAGYVTPGSHRAEPTIISPT